MSISIPHAHPCLLLPSVWEKCKVWDVSTIFWCLLSSSTLLGIEFWQVRFLCCQLAIVFHLWHDLHVVEQTLPRIIAGTWGGWISDRLPVPVFSETGCGALHACYAASTGKNPNGVSMQSFKTFVFLSASDRRMINGWDVSDGLYVYQGFIQLYMI